MEAFHIDEQQRLICTRTENLTNQNKIFDDLPSLDYKSAKDISDEMSDLIASFQTRNLYGIATHLEKLILDISKLPVIEQNYLLELLTIKLDSTEISGQTIIIALLSCVDNSEYMNFLISILNNSAYKNLQTTVIDSICKAGFRYSFRNTSNNEPFFHYILNVYAQNNENESTSYLDSWRYKHHISLSVNIKRELIPVLIEKLKNTKEPLIAIQLSDRILRNSNEESEIIGDYFSAKLADPEFQMYSEKIFDVINSNNIKSDNLKYALLNLMNSNDFQKTHDMGTTKMFKTIALFIDKTVIDLIEKKYPN